MQDVKDVVAARAAAVKPDFNDDKKFGTRIYFNPFTILDYNSTDFDLMSNLLVFH